MPENQYLIPLERIESIILVIRNEKVIVDNDLAKLYGVTTKALNQAVRRNIGRFPEDFMFQLTKDEKQEVVTNCDHLSNLKFSPNLPFAFTEHGAVMAANVLNNEKAINTSVQIVRTFVKLRKMVASNEMLRKKLNDLERKYDGQFKVVFTAIKQLISPKTEKNRKIGFISDKKKKKT
ncbi:MAG: ORF6N domain-containing protein [Pyrinomonadaceae bacterium]